MSFIILSTPGYGKMQLPSFLPGQGHRHPCAAPTVTSLGRGDPGPGCPRGLCGATRCGTLPRARLALGVLPPSRFLLTVLNSCTLVCFIHPHLPIFFFFPYRSLCKTEGWEGGCRGLTAVFLGQAGKCLGGGQKYPLSRWNAKLLL